MQESYPAEHIATPESQSAGSLDRISDNMKSQTTDTYGRSRIHERFVHSVDARDGVVIAATKRVFISPTSDLGRIDSGWKVVVSFSKLSYPRVVAMRVASLPDMRNCLRLCKSYLLDALYKMETHNSLACSRTEYEDAIAP